MTDKQRRKIVLEAKIQIIYAMNLGSPTSIFECIIEEAIQKAIDYSRCCKSDSEQLQAVEDLKEFARNNCREWNVEEMEEIIDRL